LEHDKNENRDSVTHQPIDPGLRRIQKMNDRIDFAGGFDALMRNIEKKLLGTVAGFASKISAVFSHQEKIEKSGEIIPFPTSPQAPVRPNKKPGKKAA
jgi:hypothetical protein